MDGSVMQSPGGGCVKKSKRRKKKRLKKQVVEKNEADTGDQLNGKPEAPGGIGDYRVDSHESEMDILETGLVVKVLGADSTENIPRGNASRNKKRKKKNKKAKIKDAIQSMDQAKLDQTVEVKVSCSDIEGKGRVGRLAEIKVDVPNMDQEMDTELTKTLFEGNVAGEAKKKRKKKRKRKRKSLCKMDITNDVQRMGSHEVVMDLSENLTKETVNVMAKRKTKRKRKADIKDEAESINQHKMNNGSRENLTEEIAIGKRRAENESSKLANFEEVQSMDKHKMVSELTENLAEGAVTVKGNKRKKKRSKIKYEAEIINQSEMDKGSTENFMEGIAAGNCKRRRKGMDIRVEVQIKDQPTMNIGPIENFTQGNATGNRIGESSTEGTLKDGVKGIDQNEMATGSVENLAGENVTSSTRRKRKHKKKAKINKVQNMSEQESVPKFHLSDEMRFGPLTQPLEMLESQSKCIPGEINQHICDPTSLGGQDGEFKTGLTTVSNKFKLDEVKGSSEGRGMFSTCNVKEAEYLFVKTVPVTSVRRKLLVLDVNGLLADVVNPAPKHCRGDIHISQRAIFRRPFCDDFLKFCFENFDVGIWSSRSRGMIRIVKYLLGDLYEKLLFCWDMSLCTQTGFKTLENYNKPLVCKELRKIWENEDPNLPWKKGDFDESNTLLVDDSPYKALLNPLNTAIFPSPYHYVDKNDTSLGPEGDIRVYLKELAKSENVQKHVEQHLFGQKAIDERNLSWKFYTEVLNQMSAKIGK